MANKEKLRQMLKNNEVIYAPGVYDCVSAKIAEKVGFPVIYLGGFATSASIYGKPDIGLVTGTEMISHARNIAESVQVPVLADADTGYGNPLNVRRTVQAFEKAGIAGIHIEDQVQPKKCGHLPGRNVISTKEMVAKIKSALDARGSEDFVIIARSDSYLACGLDELIERGQAYIEAGADGFFPVLLGCKSTDELKKVGKSFNVPLLLTMTHYGKQAYMTAHDAVDLGFRLLVTPWSALAVASYGVLEFMRELKEKGTFAGLMNKMTSFDDFTELLGIREVRAMESKYGIS